MFLILTAEQAERKTGLGDVDKHIDKYSEKERAREMETNRQTYREMGLRDESERNNIYNHGLLLSQLRQCSTTMQAIIIIINSYRTHGSYVYILIIIT